MRTGRPKESIEKRLSKITIDKEKIKILYLDGWTDSQVSKFLGITKRALENWKKNNDFYALLKEAKAFPDAKVEESLFKRACGYSHKAVKIFVINGKTVEHEYTENFPPDPTSCIFWLKNRKPKEWRDKIVGLIGDADDDDFCDHFFGFNRNGNGKHNENGNGKHN